MSDHQADPGHATGGHERPSRGAGTRVGDSGSPVGSPLTIVLAVIAVAVGFLIFNSISDDGDALGGLPGGDGATTTTVAGAAAPNGGTTLPSGATTTTAAVTPTRTGATVIVANASSTGQVAGPMTELLEEAGYTMGEPTSQIEGPDNLEESIVYYVVGNATEAVARSLALDMGGIEVAPMPDEDVVDSMGNGAVVLMLGNDYAGDEELPGPPPAAPAAPTSPTTTTTA